MTSPIETAEEIEAKRLAALAEYHILDTLPEQGYEDVSELAAFICDVPVSLISLVDEDRQWFKSAHGVDVSETPRSMSFCAHTIPSAQTLVVEDAREDDRFKNNPLVTGHPDIRFYAGAPIIEKGGNVLGTVCVIDTKPRALTTRQISALEALARQVMVLLEQRRDIAQLESAMSTATIADQEARASEQRWQRVTDSLPTLAWVANADGYITWYNRRWYEYTGTTPKDMEGWGWQSVHDPTKLASVMERWVRSIATHEPFEMIFPLRGADGVFRSFLTRIIPLRNDSGEVIQWLGTNAEVDELQRTQNALEASETGLNAVLNATSDGIISVNRSWTVTYANPVALRLYGQTQVLIGANLWDVFPASFYEGSPFVEHYERAMDEGVAGVFEAEYGDPIHLTVSMEVYPRQDGIVLYSRDITKMKQATAAILQNEKLAAVGRLASSIAHEINNPLEAVTNLLYLAKHSEDLSEIRAYLNTADSELRRTSAIASQTLRFHKQSTRPASVTCEDLISSVLGIHGARIQNAHVQLEKRKRARKPVVCFDGEIRQVLSNLIGNAVDAMGGTGGRLLIRSREGHDWSTGRPGLVITIADTGTGMSAATLSKLFDAFFTTKGIGGTGLGLWISKEILDRHDGRLRVRSSQRPGHTGTVFTIFLPFDATVR